LTHVQSGTQFVEPIESFKIHLHAQQAV